MAASPDSTNDGSEGVRRLAQSSRDRATRAVRDVVQRAMGPTTSELHGAVAELVALLDALRQEHEAVAQDLRGLHSWLEWRFQEIDTDTRLRELAEYVYGMARGMEESKQEVRALERRLRRLADTPRPDGASGKAAPAVAAQGPGASLDDLFDYDAFQKVFRGDPDTVFAEQGKRYAHLVEEHAPVVDVGCGRGGFLGPLVARGIAAIGVEPNPDLAAVAREAGIQVHEAYASEYLSGVPDGSLGSVVSFQVVEHMELPDLIEFIDLAAQKLAPGGVFIAETPNPASWIVMHSSFILDPSHVRPLHPGLLSFLCERAGFTDIRVEYFAPAESMYLEVPPPEDTPEWARGMVAGFSRLNDMLFGPQDYAVVARAPEPA